MIKTLIAAFISFACVGAAFADDESMFEFQVLGTFGVGFQNNKDMDDTVKGYGDYLAYGMNNEFIGGNFKGSESKANYNIVGEGELRMFMNHSLGFGLSYGVINTKAESEAKSDTWANTASGGLDLSANPLLGTVYYMIPLSDDNAWRFVMGAGFGVYFNPEIEVQYESDHSGLKMPSNETYKAKNAFGAQAKIEIQKIFWSHVSANFGLIGRYVEFKDFKKSGQTLQTKSGKNLKANFTGGGFYLSLGVVF